MDNDSDVSLFLFISTVQKPEADEREKKENGIPRGAKKVQFSAYAVWKCRL